MSALGVRHALRGTGRDGKGGPGRAQLDPAPGGPAVDLTAIFRQHYPELVRLAVMLVGDRPTAEDVVQDVFATLHARRDRPGPRGDQLAYVRACVLNGCRSALRRRAGLSRIGGSAAPVPDLPHESAEHEGGRQVAETSQPGWRQVAETSQPGWRQVPETSRATGRGVLADHQSPAGMPRPSSRCQSGASAASGLR
jgi:DNA-directed RNA polymerase specialized sigma24 family protein